MKKAFLFCTGLVAIATITLNSCKKQVDEQADNIVALTESTTDDSEADATFNDVSNGVAGANDDIGVANTEFGDDITPADPLGSKCYTITITPLTAGVFPKTVTIDFGAGCLCKDGRTRKGKIISVFSGRLRVPGSVVTTTFDGYYVNNVHVEGTHKIENNSTADIKRFTRTVTDGKLTRQNGDMITWNATHTSTQTSGLGTPNLYWDDEFDITGNATGSSSKSGKVKTWTRTITNPLHKKTNCKWFDKGTVEFTVNNRKGTLDFGTGSCDNKATVTINGFSKEITLP